MVSMTEIAITTDYPGVSQGAAYGGSKVSHSFELRP